MSNNAPSVGTVVLVKCNSVKLGQLVNNVKYGFDSGISTIAFVKALQSIAIELATSLPVIKPQFSFI